MIRKQQTGWLGIDIGSACVKVAQLARNNDGLSVVGRAIVPRSTHVPETDAEEAAEPVWTAVGEIRAAVSLERAFRGRQAAVSVPMGFCDVHQIENLPLDEGDADHLVREAIETITQCSAEDLEFDIWPAEIESQIGSQRWNVLAVARPWSDRVYHDIVDSGFACRTIDGLPHTLARAMSLKAGGEPLPPVGVLDWGFSQATFCVIAEGHPAYVRSLKDCSLDRTLSTIATELGVTLDEAYVLLEEHGVRGLTKNSVNDITAMIAELTAESVRHLEQELSRTFAHIGFQRRAIVPQQLYLFGGGALTAGLTGYLSRRLRIETHVWSLTNEPVENTRHDCLFGSALALSALAWEEK